MKNKVTSAENLERYFYEKNKALGRNVTMPTSVVVPVRKPGGSRIIGTEKIFFSNHPNPELAGTIRRIR